MSEIEIRPEEASAAARRVAAASDSIQSEGSVFRVAAQEIAQLMRYAPVCSAMMDVLGDLVTVPSEASSQLRRVAEAGSSAVDGMVAVDRNGALTMRAPGSTMVMS